MQSAAFQDSDGWFDFEAQISIPAQTDHEGATEPIYTILRWTRGAGTLSFNNCEQDLRALRFLGETVVLLGPDAELTFTDETAPAISGSRVRFTEKFICAREDNSELLAPTSIYYTHSILSPNATQGAELGNIYQGISDNVDDIEISRSYLKILLLKLKNFARPGMDSSNSEPASSAGEPTAPAPAELNRFQEFRRLVDLHFRELHRPAEYAERMFLSTRCLNVLTNASDGSSPSRIIQNRLILEARRLLRNAKPPIRAIARDLGFADAAYFSRFFQRHTGVSPASFRKTSDEN